MWIPREIAEAAVRHENERAFAAEDEVCRLREILDSVEEKLTDIHASDATRVRSALEAIRGK